MVSTHFHFNGFFPNMLYFFSFLFCRLYLLTPTFIIEPEKIPPFYGRDSPEKNAERRINKGKSGLKIFLYHYKGIETADRMSYN